MIDEDIKKLIKKVENLLKTDKRFHQNDEHLFKKQMKRIYHDEKKSCPTNIIMPPTKSVQPAKCPETRIEIREVPKEVIREVVREVPKEVIRYVNNVNVPSGVPSRTPRPSLPNLPISKTLSTSDVESGTSRVYEPSEEYQPLDFSPLNRKIEELDTMNLLKQLERIKQKIDEMNNIGSSRI